MKTYHNSVSTTSRPMIFLATQDVPAGVVPINLRGCEQLALEFAKLKPNSE